MIYGVAVNDLPNRRTQICKYVEGLTKTGKKEEGDGLAMSLLLQMVFDVE